MIVRGIPIALHDAGEGVSDEVRATGDFYEAPILDRIRELYPHHDTIVDAGANIGNHSLYFAAFLVPRAIWAFEPIPANYALLRQNLAWYHSLTAVRIALSDSYRTVWMTDLPGNLGCSRIDPEGTVEILAKPLDAFNLEHVTLLKIDVEGHEHEVIAGARHTIERWHPVILVEDSSKGKHRPVLPDGYAQVAHFGGWNDLYEWRGS